MTVFTHAHELIKTIKEVTEEGMDMIRSEKTTEAMAAIRRRTDTRPRVGIILGSGLGAVADAVENPVVIRYDEIPYWPRTTVVGHAGRLVIGMLEGIPVVTMQGRAHYYEGYAMDEITFPIRVFGELGVTSLFATNASGDDDAEGDVVDLLRLLRGRYVLEPPRGEEVHPRRSMTPDLAGERVAVHAVELRGADPHGGVEEDRDLGKHYSDRKSVV